MAKFGDLINKDKVLILFYSDGHNQCPSAEIVLKEIGTEFGPDLSTVKIDVEKNDVLADALRIKSLPAFMIYKFGKMVFRKSGGIEKHELINQLKN
ncbi:co-chaperone YbbN [Flavobacterium sp. 102]|uniref:thioredoxin family protein n=1 Tax=Flavobacterium sp. 102 TaxID=2135623 RepID=UPI000EB33448|nr:thioredoxin family protein [Flavobacterium sp. 102]RKS00442.1 thioredoxin 1 [Flavobacterium sp. 102]